MFIGSHLRGPFAGLAPGRLATCLPASGYGRWLFRSKRVVVVSR